MIKKIRSCHMNRYYYYYHCNRQPSLCWPYFHMVTSEFMITCYLYASLNEASVDAPKTLDQMFWAKEKTCQAIFPWKKLKTGMDGLHGMSARPHSHLWWVYQDQPQSELPSTVKIDTCSTIIGGCELLQFKFLDLKFNFWSTDTREELSESIYWKTE